jgi:hypothetical protein
VLERGHASAVALFVAGHAGDADLDTEIAEALGEVLLDVFGDVGVVVSAGVGVEIDGFAGLAAGELVDGHPGLAALDVPKSLVDTADGVVEDGPVLPVGAVIAALPGVFDPVGWFADQEWLEVELDGGLDKVGALGKGSASVAVKTILIGCNLDDAES